jgi:hypothetical protein
MTNLDFGLSGRAEYTVMGPAKEYDDFTAMGNTQDLLVIGGGVDWSEGGSNDVVFHTVDVQYENTKGLGLYGAILGMWRDLGAPVAPVVAGNFYDIGALAQASYMVNPTCEVFGRAEYIQIDTDAIPGVATHENLQELTIGTNYYWRGHNVKLTVDVNWLPNGSPITLPLLDVRAGDGQQVLLRFQGQLLL